MGGCVSKKVANDAILPKEPDSQPNENAPNSTPADPAPNLEPQEVESDEEEDLCEYYKILSWKSASSSLFHQEEMNALVTAFFYCVKSVTKRQMKRAPRSSSAKEYLFRDFVELLSSLHPKPRQLRYYAERLCVTPRYLSLACKECSGQTASQLIDLYVTKEIEYLLRHSAKSIKEICMELGFPNQSTFAKYVREHLGTSPKQYRKGMGDGSAA